jgi:hypothetical protein
MSAIIPAIRHPNQVQNSEPSVTVGVMNEGDIEPVANMTLGTSNEGEA